MQTQRGSEVMKLIVGQTGRLTAGGVGVGALLAGYLPVRRASRIEPIVALRAE